jgi:hypothetical protein
MEFHPLPALEEKATDLLSKITDRFSYFIDLRLRKDLLKGSQSTHLYRSSKDFTAEIAESTEGSHAENAKIFSRRQSRYSRAAYRDIGVYRAVQD